MVVAKRIVVSCLCGVLLAGVAACGSSGPQGGTHHGALDAGSDIGGGDGGQFDVGELADAGTDVADAAVDTADTGMRRGLPHVAGPPPETYDCRAAGQTIESHSTVAHSCVLDPQCHDAMVVAHRGAGGLLGVIAPENSLSAIRAALLMGVDGVEVDVRDTADGKLVLMHDDTVDRTTDGTGKVAEMTLAQVTALHLKRSPDMADDFGDFSCETVPTLAQLLALVHGRVFVDLDTKTSRVDLVVAAIKKADALDDVFISVSDPARAEQARAIDPSVHIQVRPDSEAALDDALTRFDRTPEIIEIPDTKIADWSDRIHNAGAKVFSDAFMLDAGAYRHNTGQPYLDAYADGADILQSEFAPLVLDALDRWDY